MIFQSSEHFQRFTKSRSVANTSSLSVLLGLLRKLFAVLRQKRLHHSLNGRLVVLHRRQTSFPHSFHQFTSRFCNKFRWRFCATSRKSVCRYCDRVDRNRLDSGNLGFQLFTHIKFNNVNSF